MPDADAVVSASLDEDALSAGLDAIAAKFGVIAEQINAQFAGANAQLSQTAVAAGSIGAQAPMIARLGSGLALAAQAARTVTNAFSGVVTAATRIAPFVKFVPDSLGKWVPPVKAAAAEFNHVSAQIGTVVKTAQALTGRLTVLNAGFMALNLREVGASRSMALFGAASALAMSKTVEGARGAIGMVGALGGAIGAATRRAGGMLGTALGGLGTALGGIAPMAGMALMLGPVAGAATVAAGAFGGLGHSINSAAQMQSFTASMATLLGSTEAARARMAELNQFAAETPFELPGVVQASKVLQTLTNGALATGAGLRMVGDLASVAGQPFEELAMHVGRLYDGLMNGRPVGESMQRLQELGLVSAATRTKLENLQQSGSKGGDVWKVAAADLMRFSGEMQRQSLTWGGIMSNFSDGVGRIFQAIGAPLITALSPFMLRMNAWLATLIPWAERFGQIIAGWGAVIAQIFADGQAGKALSLSLQIGFASAVNFLVKGLVGAGDALLSILTSANAWKAVGSAMSASGEAMLTVITEGLAKAVDSLRSLPFIGGAAGSVADALHGAAGVSAQRAEDSGKSALNSLSNMAPEIGAAFSDGFKSTGDVLDASGAKNQLGEIFHGAATAAKADIDRVSADATRGNLPAAKPTQPDDESGKKGKGGIDVASLQKIAGGGGFAMAGRDPLLNTAKSQLDETKKTNTKIDGLTNAISRMGVGGGVPVFG